MYISLETKWWRTWKPETQRNVFRVYFFQKWLSEIIKHYRHGGLK